jgi:CRP/FNR family transcriptional regulator, cyclic AMP receptor protein
MSEDFSGLFASETEVISLAAGEVLFEKGQPGHLMYVVKSGGLQILEGNYVYETVSAGGILGEMALVDGSPRSATARAIESSTVIPIDERRFLFIGAADAILRSPPDACNDRTNPGNERAG